MKKIYSLFIVGLFFILPFSVKAASFDLDLSCDAIAAEGDLVTCKMRLLSLGDTKLHQISGTLPTSSNFQIQTFEQGVMECTSTAKTFECTSKEGIKTSNILFTFYAKVVYDGDYDKGKSEELEIITSKINGDTVVSTIDSNTISFQNKHQSKLTNLSVRDEKLYPTFDPNVMTYELSTTKDSITISGTLKDPSSKTDIRNLSSYTVKLEYGANIIPITVTAQDGSKRVYTIVAVRIDNRSDDNKLQLLTVNGEEIELVEDKYLYEIEVENSVEHAKVLCAPSNSSAKVEMDGNEDLVVGNNRFIINVTSELGNTLQYVLNIKRKAEVKSDNIHLKTLKIKNVENGINFEMDTYSYDLYLPKKIKSLEIEAETEDEKATYEIVGNEDLGNNSRVQIKVTAENGTVGNYSIFIQKDVPNYRPLIIGVLITLSIIGVGFFIYFLKKKRDRKIDSYLSDTIVMKSNDLENQITQEQNNVEKKDE